MVKKKQFQNGLLKWIQNKNEEGIPNYRNFIWRKSIDPYVILITEILLQKTNAEKVSEIFSIFFNKFPTIKDLYESNIENLIEILKRLGLQNEKSKRIKNLAKKIFLERNGIIPNTKEQLLMINGVGKYMANAVLCFAFNKRYEIVDSNIIRIYQRIFNLKSKSKRPRTDKKVWEFARIILPLDYFKLFNFALLDFGAKICTAKNPKCLICFFKEDCYYFTKSSSN